MAAFNNQRSEKDSWNDHLLHDFETFRLLELELWITKEKWYKIETGWVKKGHDVGRLDINSYSASHF
jgi:hypothetical protein